MSWAKRNLYFLIACILAVLLLGAAGWYCYSEWKSNNDNWEKLHAAYEEMGTLAKDSPSKENIDKLRQEIASMKDISGKMAKSFVPVPPIPNTPRVDDLALANALGSSINQLRASAVAN